jgi:hypothetical protein
MTITGDKIEYIKLKKNGWAIIKLKDGAEIMLHDDSLASCKLAS